MSFASACAVTDLAEAAPLAVVVNGVDVCVVRVAEQVFAVQDECTHESVPLSEGDVDDGAIECWRHGSRFDLRTGAVLNPPAIKPVVVYPTRIVCGHVQIDLGV